MKGGTCSAADYGTYLWGTNQQAGNSNGNLIQPLNDPANFKGGKRKSKKGGHGILTTASVPALLISTNHFYNPKRVSKKNRTKRIKGGEQPDVASLINKINNINQPTSGIIHSNSPTIPSIKGGKGIITSIAVPAVLLTANHLYRPKKTKRRYSNKRGYFL